MRKIIQRTAMGVSIGCTIFVIIGISMCLFNQSGTVFIRSDYGFIKSAICSIIVGIGFSLPSLIYDCPKLARPMQTLIHLAIGLIVYGAVAIYAQWIPVEHGATAIALFLGIGVASTALIWGCFYLYYKFEATKINEEIKRKRRKE